MSDKLNKFTFQGHNVDLSNINITKATTSSDKNKLESCSKYPSRKQLQLT